MWSPQRYKAAGIALGHDVEVVDRATTAIDQFLERQPKLPAILTLKHLSERVSLPYKSLHQMVGGSRAEHYKYFRIKKRAGGRRLISVPEPSLMLAQQWIASHILSKIPTHRASYAFAPASSIVKCANQHCEARWLIKLDIAGFFGSISEIAVYRVFRSVDYVPLVAMELTRLCTHAPSQSSRYQRREWQLHRRNRWGFYLQPNLGYLPQGAPTSPMLSNLVMRETDHNLAKIAREAGLSFTRYSDDITFSTQGNFDRTRAAALLTRVTTLLGRNGLRINKKKTRIVPPGGRKIVLGLLVDGKEPRLTREFRDCLRQHLYYLEKLGPEAHRQARGFDTIAGLYRHVLGLIDFSNSVDAPFAEAMRTKFKAIPWSLEA